MKTTLLTDHWTLHQTGENETFEAPVPGSVHDALLAADAIPDAHIGYGERDQLWVGEADWTYFRTLDVAPEFLTQEQIKLVFEGLDTFADIFLNEVKIGTTGNMYRTYRFDVKEILRAGENTLRVEFSSAGKRMLAGDAQRHLPVWNESDSTVDSWGYIGRGYARKQACQCGWDWGMQSPSAGIWKPVYLEGWSTARIEDWHVTQDHRPNGSVQLTVCVRPDSGADLQISADLMLEGETVASADEPFFGGWEWQPIVDHPELWWPNGMGDQPLYTLCLILSDSEGKELDRVEKRIGLRTVNLIREPDEFGTSLCFKVNGQRLFAKGSNWIPLDTHPSGQNLKSRYARDLQSAADANMNMLRVWGGGYFSHDFFYDRCDELGLLIWQDFMFGCGAYPVWDKTFREEAWQEVVDNATHLRHHACLACWCGNNELEQGFTADRWRDRDGEDWGRMAWSSYFDLFERILPSALALVDPNTPYIPGSPHCAAEERRDYMSDRSGDFHDWNVWFSDVPFEVYRENSHRFMSEFGFQSFPESGTLRAVAPNESDLEVQSDWLSFRQRSGPGNARIITATVEWFGANVTEDFERFCELSQVMQGEGLKIGIECWRSRYPQMTGATYWQLNDRWAAPTWATLDVHGNWKASHYITKRFFAPLLITGVEDRESGSVEIHLINDGTQPIEGKVEIEITTASGRRLHQEVYAVETNVCCVPKKLKRLECKELLDDEWDPMDCLVWLRFVPNDSAQRPATNLIHFVRPTQLALQPAELDWNLTDSNTAGETLLTVENKSASPALWVTARSPHPFRADDLYFHLKPNETRRILLHHAPTLSAAAFAQEFQMLSFHKK